MKLLHLSFATLILRFYLMMAIIIAAGFMGQWLLALAALPVFVSCLLGVQIAPGKVTTSGRNIHTLSDEKIQGSVQNAA